MTLQIRIDNFCKKLNKPITKRNIFGAPDPEEVENLYQNEMNNERQSFEDSFPGMLKTMENIENHRQLGKARRKLNVCLFGQPNPSEIHEMVKEVEMEDKLKLREVYGLHVELEDNRRNPFRSNPGPTSKKRKRNENSDEENSHPINKKSKRRLIYSGGNNNNNNKTKRITDFFQQRKNGPLSENKSDVHTFH